MNAPGNETQKELETLLVPSSSPALLCLPPAPHSVLGGNISNSRLRRAQPLIQLLMRTRKRLLELYLSTIVHSSLPPPAL